MPSHAAIDAVLAWARSEPDIEALVLVGSHARGTATPASDIDFLLLTRSADRYLQETSWLSRFGEPITQAVEDWGDVTALRVRYRDGQELEFGFTGRDWGAGDDPGAARVLREGAVILFDRDLDLAARFQRRIAGATDA